MLLSHALLTFCQLAGKALGGVVQLFLKLLFTVNILRVSLEALAVRSGACCVFALGLLRKSGPGCGSKWSPRIRSASGLLLLSSFVGLGAQRDLVSVDCPLADGDVD